MKLGKCIKKAYDCLGQGADVTSLLASRCSGRPSCEMPVNDDLLFGTSPCAELQVYLEVTYLCVKVSVSQSGDCRRHENLQVKLNDSVVISSMTSEKEGQGHRGCPWLLTALPGQTISVVLHSYIEFQAVKSADGSPEPKTPSCHEVAVLEDGPIHKAITACTPDPSASLHYQSKTNRLLVTLPQRNKAHPHGAFLLEFKVVGCPSIDTPVGATQKISETGTTIFCNNSGQSWHLTCKGTEWIGTAGKCSGESSKTFGHRMNDGTFPYGLLVAVAIGVALGVFCGGLLLTIVAFRNKRRRLQHCRQVEQTYYATNKAVPCAEMRHLPSTGSDQALSPPPDLTGTLHYCPTHHRDAFLVETPSDYYMKSSAALTLDKSSTNSTPLSTFTGEGARIAR